MEVCISVVRETAWFKCNSIYKYNRSRETRQAKIADDNNAVSVLCLHGKTVMISRDIETINRVIYVYVCAHESDESECEKRGSLHRSSYVPFSIPSTPANINLAHATITLFRNVDGDCAKFLPRKKQHVALAPRGGKRERHFHSRATPSTPRGRAFYLTGKTSTFFATEFRSFSLHVT